MTDKICLNCRFFHSSAAEVKIGNCRYLPATDKGFPAVSQHDWCGSYQERAADTSDPKDPPVFGLPNKA